MFAEDMTTPGEREYVSPDGSLVVPAARVCRQGPDGSYPGMDPSGWRSGESIGRIDVPERPVQLIFGGPDRRTLFILAHRALYAVQMRAPGEPLPWAP